MKPTVNRMKAILDALQTTPNAFAQAHGFNVSTIYGFANKSHKPGFDLLCAICVAEPRISLDYLLRGEGSPLRDTQPAPSSPTAPAKSQPSPTQPVTNAPARSTEPTPSVAQPKSDQSEPEATEPVHPTEPDQLPEPAPAKPLQGLASVSMSEVETLLTTLKQIYDERLVDQSVFPLTLVLKPAHKDQLTLTLAYAKHPDLVNYMTLGFKVYCDELKQIGSGQPSAGQVLQPSTYYGKTVYRYGPESGILRTDGYTDLLAYFLSQSHRFGALHAFGQRAMASIQVKA